MENAFATLMALVGFPAFLAAAINLAKSFGMPDGYAPKVLEVVNFIAFGVVFYFVQTDQVELITRYDANLGVLSTFIVAFTVFVTEIGLTKVYHQALKGLPVIGYSYSTKLAEAKKK